jgi:hypothetical protein
MQIGKEVCDKCWGAEKQATEGDQQNPINTKTQTPKLYMWKWN